MIKRVIYIDKHIKNLRYQPPKEMFPNYFTYGQGGRLGRNFKKYNPSWEVEVWRVDTGLENYMEAEIDNVVFRIFPAIGNRHLDVYSFSFIKKLRSLPDKSIINIQNIHRLFFYQILFLVKKGIIVTAQRHGDWSPHYLIKYSIGWRKLKAIVHLFIENLVINRVDYFFIIEKKHIGYLSKNYKNLEGKYSIQAVGVEIENFYPISKIEAQKELGLDPHKKYLFYLGQYYHYKQVDRLCEIYLRVKKKYSNLQLIVAGGKPDDMYYHKVVEVGAIDFGKILQKELYKYFSAVDIYVAMTFRDDYYGGVGLSMLESLACGTPVVSKSLENTPTEFYSKVGRVPQNEEQMVEDILYILNNEEEFKFDRKIVSQFFGHENLQLNTARIYNNLLETKDDRNC